LDTSQDKQISRNQGSGKIQVPVYILEFATTLFEEEKLQKDDIATILTQQGENKLIVDAVIQSLPAKRGSI